jgi:hypothetical protein
MPIPSEKGRRRVWRRYRRGLKGYWEAMTPSSLAEEALRPSKRETNRVSMTSRT